MNPVKSNLPNKTCAEPVPSNCTIWNGDNLNSIPVCQGDSISSIIEKLDQELFYIKSLLNLTNLDLSCISNQCTTCPDKTLPNILQLFINYICGSGNVPAQCPTMTVTPAIGSIGFTMAPFVTSNVTYVVELYDSLGITVIRSLSYTDPTSLQTGSFNNLPSLTGYQIKVTVNVTGQSPVICTPISTTTL